MWPQEQRSERKRFKDAVMPGLKAKWKALKVHSPQDRRSEKYRTLDGIMEIEYHSQRCAPPDGRAPVSTMSLFHRSLWHLQKSDESQRMITDCCEPNWGGAPSQLPGNCCTYHAPIDQEDLAGKVISNSSHSPGMNNSTFVILTQGHFNILMIKGLGLPGTSAETHSGLLYWWHHFNWTWGAGSSFRRNTLVRYIKTQDPARVVVF